MSEKIGCLIVDLQDKALTEEEREILTHPLVGGVILFTRNYESRLQLRTLCQNIRATRTQPLIIMVDQEGGRVQRFIAEFTRLPYMGQFGKIYENDNEKACQLARTCGRLMATELLSVQIDLSLAPVLDLNKGISNVIGERAFHANPEIVITLAKAFIAGMWQAGMAATGKHFPGHGSVIVDSHTALPIDTRSLSAITDADLIPFADLIKSGINAIMAAHIIFPQVDMLPVGFSRHWLQDILRSQLHFSGPILSDDLNMEGANISANYADRVSAAREAGCDFTLLCNNRAAVVNVLDSLSRTKSQVSREKWGGLQGNFSQVKEPLALNKDWQEAHAMVKSLLTV